MKMSINILRDNLVKARGIIKYVSYASNLSAITVLIFWLIGKKVVLFGTEYDHEPLFAVLTGVFATLTQLYRWLLTESEFSPAHALALGYVKNFISPTITQLMQDGVRNPIIYIYRPKSIAELYGGNISRVRSKLEQDNFKLVDINLTTQSARARDIILIEKSTTKKVYFDFPNTLTSLVSYVDYRIGSNQDSNSDRKKDKFTEELIEKFFSKVDELLTKENIKRNVKYCDQSLSFQF
jgi:hypothetical protein